jgi:MerR family transcriptional regulator, light-induced transcriptional regulator
MERFNEGLLLTTTQVATLLSVHPSTVKRWSNEGEVEVDKTEGGHRRIHLQDALALARKRGIDTFLDPFTPYEGHVWTALDQVVATGSFARVHTLALGWLRRGHLDRLGRMFQALGRHPEVPFPAFCDHGVRGFMEEVGALWRSGSLRVGEEHMASERLVESLLALRTEPGASRAAAAPPPRAVVGAMEGDRHHLGALCVRLLLERRGWEVFYLGADVPVEDFAAIQRARQAELVCVSFAPPNTAADMMRCVRILTGFYDRSHPYALALGGAVDDPPTFDGPAPPFGELGVYRSITEFETELNAGQAR